MTKEKQIHKEGEGYHGDGAEEKHHDKIGRLSPKTALFKHPGMHASEFCEDLRSPPAVSVGEDHIEEEVESKSAKEEEGCD